MNQLSIYHCKLTLIGLVQGVGYRPFVRRAAMLYGITGDVCNFGGGVSVNAFGNKEALDSFVECLLSSPPKGTVYVQTQVSTAAEVSNAPSSFTIRQSEQGRLLAILPPDLAPCEDCLREMNEPNHRRYGYPFQSCAICGPRYSIQTALPYDRPATTMKNFLLCDACEAEYNAPHDRRSYAQTIACKDCGPRLAFYPKGKSAPVTGDDDALASALEALRWGEIVAVKNNGGFHLACLADDADAIARLRWLKGREEKPFALLFGDLDAIRAIATVSDAEADLLASSARPIVLLTPHDPSTYQAASGESIRIGAMLPSTPLQQLLSKAGALVMTSANPSGEPIYTEFAPLADWIGEEVSILTHDRPIVTPQDDSLLYVENDRPCFLRRSRGYAPLPIAMDKGVRVPTICYGGDLKASFALCKDEYVYLSQYTGDLAHEPIQQAWSDLQNHLSGLLSIIPEQAVCDLHPGYFSHKEAEECGLPLRYVQHHHAHIASVMAEHGVRSVIGFAFDGTGYGEDGSIWGGEVFFCEGGNSKRIAHLQALPMPMGDDGAIDTIRLARFFRMGAGITPQNAEEKLIYAAVQAGIGIPTSSMGRLFDAVSAMLGLCAENTYEGRAAILLENAATLWEGAPIDLSLPLEGDTFRSDLLLSDLAEQIHAGAPAGALALGFHHAIAHAVGDAALRFAKEYDCPRIALSGGVFANQLLLRLCRERIESNGLTVYRNEKVPVGDGGIALGQAYIAAHSVKND